MKQLQLDRCLTKISRDTYLVLKVYSKENAINCTDVSDNFGIREFVDFFIIRCKIMFSDVKFINKGHHLCVRLFNEIVTMMAILQWVEPVCRVI